LVLPSGPGVRVDAGIESGSMIGGNFDSLLAKVIVTGETRSEALERSRRVLDEMVVDGMATALPFHRLIVRDPAFTSEPFSVHTRWIETEWAGEVPPFSTPAAPSADEPVERETVVVEVGGKRVEVTLPAFTGTAVAELGGRPATATRRGGPKRSTPTASGDALTSPMQGTIVKVAVSDGDEVAAGDLIVVLEAMKMEQPLNAHKAGMVSGLTAKVGDAIASGAAICEIK
jgi:acetyl-CoA/propionyl-CoA carboxylase biotin carboxyl carrier protein